MSEEANEEVDEEANEVGAVMSSEEANEIPYHCR
jgi:hypothetical protein